LFLDFFFYFCPKVCLNRPSPSLLPERIFLGRSSFPTPLDFLLFPPGRPVIMLLGPLCCPPEFSLYYGVVGPVLLGAGFANPSNFRGAFWHLSPLQTPYSLSFLFFFPTPFFKLCGRQMVFREPGWMTGPLSLPVPVFPRPRCSWSGAEKFFFLPGCTGPPCDGYNTSVFPLNVLGLLCGFSYQILFALRKQLLPSGHFFPPDFVLLPFRG